MTRPGIKAALAGAALLLSGPADAQADRRLLESFGLLSLEEHVEAESQLRRALFVDDRGRPAIAIVFLRSPFGEPVLRVHFARPGDAARITPLAIRVPPAEWQSVLQRSERFERESEAGAPAAACSGGWTYTVEATDPSGPAMRSRSEHGCADGLAGAYARDLADAALALLPACAGPDFAGTAVDHLAACRGLRLEQASE